MRAFILLLTVAFGLVTNALAAPADAEAVFTKANTDYAAGKFPESIAGYESLVKDGKWNANLFYDLGNAYYRAGETGRAVLNYERALALDPAQPEARANLQLVRDQTRALQLAPGWVEGHLRFLSRDQFTWLAAIAFWGAAAILAGLYFMRRRPVVWIFAFLVLATIAGGAAFAGYALETGTAGQEIAIITQKKIQARLATAESAGTVLVLPPGSEVKILSTRGDWIYAALPNDLQGWIPAGSAERVRL